MDDDNSYADEGGYDPPDTGSGLNSSRVNGYQNNTYQNTQDNVNHKPTNQMGSTLKRNKSLRIQQTNEVSSFQQRDSNLYAFPDEGTSPGAGKIKKFYHSFSACFKRPPITKYIHKIVLNYVQVLSRWWQWLQDYQLQI